MKHSYLPAGIKFGNLISMIFRNKGFSVRYIFRLLFLLNAGLWSSIFSAVERKRYGKKISSFNNKSKPVFIVGNWRTGTTLLHQLLSLNNEFVSPSVYQVSNPDHFLVSKKYYEPLMSKVLDDKRPMDNVKIGPDEPQEDEYALLKMCKKTPLEDLMFSKGNFFFLNRHINLISYNEDDLKKALSLFEKKLRFLTNKRVIFKNPFHSLRISLIREIFPEAKFIHIYRNPIDVVPSAVNMWNIVGRQNILKGVWTAPSISEISDIYIKIITTVRQQFTFLKEKQSCEIKFEDLEKNPVECIKKVYNTLEFEFSSEFEDKLKKYCKVLQDYKKNKYETESKDKMLIKQKFADLLPEYFSETH